MLSDDGGVGTTSSSSVRRTRSSRGTLPGTAATLAERDGFRAFVFFAERARLARTGAFGRLPADEVARRAGRFFARFFTAARAAGRDFFRLAIARVLPEP